MLELGLIVYSLAVWLVFIKYELITWSTTNKIIVFTIPVVAIVIIVLLMNIFMPTSNDVRVFNKTVQIKTNVRGRIQDIRVEPLEKVSVGDTLFIIEQKPFIAQLEGIKASIEKAAASIKGQSKELDALLQQRKVAQTQLDLALKRKQQFKDLVDYGAGNKFDLENAESTVEQLRAELARLNAKAASLLIGIEAEYDGNQVSVAELMAKAEKAKWELEQTIVRAPIDGTIINLQVRPGTMALPVMAVMTIVEDRQDIVASFDQNELHRIEKGDEVEITFITKPGHIVHGVVDNVIWASSRGQLLPSGIIPKIDQEMQKPGKYIVKFKMNSETPIPMGANGMVAVYTSSTEPLYIVRKVMVRISAKFNYLILKAH
ncbi:HlyD family secretion protein [Flammeovirga pectinis]|uniref:HlyD family secretion protein n=1 Tax=Flammeovirga pectinis TaxID=2494373 RepID=A0A3Q9FML5_9BACT|nr:efflux RND transporter periplasmic adaptor subunit [Flammeovirga pectinis]AZQ63617.1 HlyD family secretion protein [Flammeovirga pectinis]